ncbi:hypothetical protein D3C75_693830 [compost metagenome]
MHKVLLAGHLLRHLQLRQCLDQRGDIHMAVAVALRGKVQPLLRAGFREQVIGWAAAEASIAEQYGFQHKPPVLATRQLAGFAQRPKP